MSAAPAASRHRRAAVRAVVSETAARGTVDDASKYEPDFYDRLAALVRETATRA